MKGGLALIAELKVESSEWVKPQIHTFLRLGLNHLQLSYLNLAANAILLNQIAKDLVGV